MNSCTGHDKRHAEHFMVMLIMLMSSYGLSVLGLTLTLEILWTTSMPFAHLPNTVCLLSSQGWRRGKKKKRQQNSTEIKIIKDVSSMSHVLLALKYDRTI